jgi:DNA-binding MurR/RpiR family transcriptional regulator
MNKLNQFYKEHYNTLTKGEKKIAEYFAKSRFDDIFRDKERITEQLK